MLRRACANELPHSHSRSRHTLSLRARKTKPPATQAYQLITALFTNMRVLKFKSQLTIAFFAAVNHLNGPLRKQNFTLTGSKGHTL